MEKEKRILVDNGVRTKLLEYGTYPTIRKALSGDASTPQKLKIREAAIRMGGVKKEDIPEINNETSSETTDCTPIV